MHTVFFHTRGEFSNNQDSVTSIMIHKKIQIASRTVEYGRFIDALWGN